MRNGPGHHPQAPPALHTLILWPCVGEPATCVTACAVKEGTEEATGAELHSRPWVGPGAVSDTEGQWFPSEQPRCSAVTRISPGHWSSMGAPGPGAGLYGQETQR